MNKYEVLEMIDEGAYGIVLKARNRETGELVAIKKFKDLEDDEEVVRSIQREVKMLRRLRSSFVVDLKEAFRRKGRVYLVFEFMQKNVLHLIEERTGGLEVLQSATQPHLIRQVIFRTVQALQFLHSQNVAHRDVKPENLLLNLNDRPDGSGMELKICDFGFTRFLDSEPSHLTDYVATRWYRSPELLVRDRYDTVVDMWAVGCIMGELADGQPMFAGQNEIDQLFLIMKIVGPLTRSQQQCLQKNFKGVKFPPIRVRAPLDLKYVDKFGKEELSFLKECLKMDPAERLTAEKALQHPYLAGLSNSAEQSLPPTMTNGTSPADGYQNRPSYRAKDALPTPRMAVHDDSKMHQSNQELSYMLKRHTKNQQSLATLKPSEPSRHERKEITHKVQLQLFPSYALSKKTEGQTTQLKSQRQPVMPALDSRGSIDTKLRLPIHHPISTIYHMHPQLNSQDMIKPTLSKISLTKRTLQTKSNSQPYMSLEIAQPPKIAKILKKSQALRLGNSLSRPRLHKPTLNF